MPTIEISDETFKKLKTLAEPLVDTAETVIARLVNAAVEHGKAGPHAPKSDADVVLDPEAPGNLAFTRVRRAKIGKEEILKPNWNRLLRRTHVVALEELGSVGALRQITGAHIRAGHYDKEGFSYISEADISMQGLDSNLAWENSLRVAKYLGIPIEVEFEWYNKDGAAHPGKSGRTSWAPKEE
jgi:hypothetical protein